MIKDGINVVGLLLVDGGLCYVEELDFELGVVGKVMLGDFILL